MRGMSASISPLIVPANGCRRERWRNGAGWTREILCVPGRDADWAARLSIAEIETEADYSLFPGVMREQVLLSGDGLELRFADGARQELLPPHGTARFSGQRPLRGRPLGRRAEAFNLMWRPDALDAHVLHRPLVGPMLFFCDATTSWAVHLMGGRARLGRVDDDPVLLERGDTALLHEDAGRRFLLDGGADLLLVRFDRLPPPGDPLRND